MRGKLPTICGSSLIASGPTKILMAHHCHATDCKTPVPPEMFMCRMHWYKVPYNQRQAVWRAYRVGQCDDMNPNQDYCLAAREAVITVARKENKTPDTCLYDVFLKGM